MPNNVIRFDDFHPNFADTPAPEMTLQIEVRARGLYLGSVQVEPRIEAFGRDWSSLGPCASVEQAIDSVVAAAAV